MGRDRPLAQTPHLDRLAATGVRFTQAVTNLPVCVPCRHSFITGMYPHQIGILTNAHYWPDQPPVPTLGQWLKGAGYATAAIGKMPWKTGRAPAEHVPDKRGFDYRVTRGGTTDGPYDLSLTDLLRPEEVRLQQETTARFGADGESREGYVGAVSPLPGHRLLESRLVDQAVQYLHRRMHDAQPFCLLVSLYRPHPPNVIPADYAGRYDPALMPMPPAVPPGFLEDDPYIHHRIVSRGWGRMEEREVRLSVAGYLTNVTYVDHCLGQVLTALADSGLEEDTLVVFLSDHGELLGERARGYTKHCLYDSALRVPLLIRWPGLNRAGHVSDAPVELVDLLPTWLEAAGLEVPPFLPGRSLRPLLMGQRPGAVSWREATFSEEYSAVGVPRGQWAMREHRFKLIERGSSRSALYDLQDDPNELRNRIDDPTLAGVRERLRLRLLQHAITCAEQFPAQYPTAMSGASAAATPAASSALTSRPPFVSPGKMTP